MNSLESRCKICGSAAHIIFSAMVLQKYKTNYYQCEDCKFIQTEAPFWLPEAYQSAMTALDVGLVYRNTYFAKVVPPLLDLLSNTKSCYLDYGGGYGMFTRMMRDLGYRFYLYDAYADNLYAKYFELSDYKSNDKFACLTAFEVFEHLENPVEEIEKMFTYSDTIIFSTEIQPDKPLVDDTSWWYIMPEIGQHVSFFSTGSLRKLSNIFDCHLYTNSSNLHILSKVELSRDPFLLDPVIKPSFPERILKWALRKIKKETLTDTEIRKSLLQDDYNQYKAELKNSKS